MLELGVLLRSSAISCTNIVIHCQHPFWLLDMMMPRGDRSVVAFYKTFHFSVEVMEFLIEASAEIISTVSF